MSPELKNLFTILTTRKERFTEDKKSLIAAGETLNATRGKYGYSSTAGLSEFQKEVDKDARTQLLTAYDNVQLAMAKMKDRNALVDNARKTIKSLGFKNENISWLLNQAVKAGDPTDKVPLDEEKSSLKASPFAWTGYATGGLVSSKFAQKKFNMGTDTVPAMLTPGEFVMNKFAVQSHGIGKMQAMNNGQAAGDSVYNYSISVNVKSESNPDEIARTVIAQIKSVDAQKMRGVRT
jgi:hypothetical protein